MIRQILAVLHRQALTKGAKGSRRWYIVAGLLLVFRILERMTSPRRHR